MSKNKNCMRTLVEVCHMRFPLNMWNCLWDNMEKSICSYVKYVVLWISMAVNLICFSF
jgi:hypothetical protein